MYDEKFKIVLPQPLIWKDVKGFVGAYKVSNYGSVKSLPRTVSWVTKTGKNGKRCVPERILSPKTDKDGYFEYVLSIDGERTYKRGHRIVAEAFNPNSNSMELVIDHINANKKCNFSWNLQWITSEENTIKYYAEEFGKEKTLSKVTHDEWKEIGILYNKGTTYKDIVKIMNLTVENPDSIFDVISGRRLSSVSGFKKGDFELRPQVGQKVTDEQVFEMIYERKVNKIPLKELRNRYGIADSMISRFCSGIKRPHLLERFNKEYNKQEYLNDGTNI